MYQGGHSPIKLIAKALEAERLAHAYLIVDHRSNARRKLLSKLAALLICDNPLRSEKDYLSPCNQCTSCKKLASLTHPDFIQIEPENDTIRIEQIRHIQEQVVFAPLEGKRRVVLIHDAEALGINAANALLKILEEPPEHNLFLLSASSTGTILPTILSRCQILRHHPSHRDLDELKDLSESISSNDQGFLEFLINDLALDDKDKILEVLDAKKKLVAFLESKDKDLTFLEGVAHLASSKEMVRLSVSLIGSILRDLFIIKATCKNDSRNHAIFDNLINRDITHLLGRLAQSVNYDTLIAYEQKLRIARTMLERNVKPEMIMEMLLIFWLKIQNRAQGN